MPPFVDEAGDEEDGDPSAETLDDVPTATPMDLFTLSSLVAALDGLGTPEEQARTAALAARIESARAVPPP